MKKIRLVLILIITWSGLLAQLGNPIMDYNEDGYTISEVKKFSSSDIKLAKEYRLEMVKIINTGLAEAGEDLVLSESKSDVDWILSQVSYEIMTIPIGYINSRVMANKTMNFFSNKKKDFSGEVGVFIYGKCRIVLFKTICMNLLKIPVEIIKQDPPKKPESEPEPEPELFVYTPPVEKPFVYREAFVEEVDLNLPPYKTSFFQRTGVKIGGVTLLVGGLVWTGFKIFKKPKGKGHDPNPNPNPNPIIPIVPDGPGHDPNPSGD